MKDKELEKRVAAKAEEREAQRKVEAKEKAKEKEASVAAGPVDKIVDVLVNPAPHKILEFTDLDRNQVVLIPQLAIIDDVWEYCTEVAMYHENPAEYQEEYKKVCPSLGNPIKRFIFLIAQCRRSLGGKTQKALEDLALADLEARSLESKEGFGDIDFESEGS